MLLVVLVVMVVLAVLVVLVELVVLFTLVALWHWCPKDARIRFSLGRTTYGKKENTGRSMRKSTWTRRLQETKARPLFQHIVVQFPAHLPLPRLVRFKIQIIKVKQFRVAKWGFVYTIYFAHRIGILQNLREGNSAISPCRKLGRGRSRKRAIDALH